MAFSYVGGAYNSGTLVSSISVTHGLTISSGDLVVAYVNRDDSINISNDAGGAAWTEALQQTPPSGETASHALFWKIAGASEPATYTWSLNASDDASAIVKVFSSASDAEVDAAANGTKESTSSTNMICNAADGEVISNNAVSIICGGKDRDNTPATTWTSADNSYVSVLGDNLGRYSAMAHRIYTTGTTFSGDITISPTGTANADTTYSIHISFVESGGGGGIAVPIAYYHRNQFNRG